ncbi:bifunctional PIG-L family deacetylase/class I SAM-dependent methyltransferase [Arthrobacter globiformis]|uniref:PIG-L family deacetylase n=1 Tax=Arthrobacter globiformis TaxID=1665 RepID=UPI00397A2DD3
MVSFSHTDAGTEEAAWAASGLDAIGELPLDSAELARMEFVVLVAHPDDESLGAGGLLARLTSAGARVEVLLCSAGEASHPDSPTTTPEQLAAVRRAEFGAAMAALGLAEHWQFLNLPDGGLAGHRAVIAERLADAVGQRNVVIVAPFRGDGHIDHDTLGAVAAETAAGGGHGLLEYPIWYWLWATPRDTAWQNWVRLPLGPDERRAKRDALHAHASQLQPLSNQPGDEVLLSEQFLSHFSRPFEVFAWQPPVAGRRSARDAEAVFDALHRSAEDPWRYQDSWYEQRKRGLTLAALPEQKYDAGLEAGCSIGTLSAELAKRCGRFLAVDASGTAAARAAERLAGYPGAEARQLTLPDQWPAGSFDLIVVSEMGYYLSAAELKELFTRISASLLPGGTLLLCHWRHPVSGWELDGDAVHAMARRQLGWPSASVYRERDFVLETFVAPEAARATGPEGARDAG